MLGKYYELDCKSVSRSSSDKESTGIQLYLDASVDSNPTTVAQR